MMTRNEWSACLTNLHGALDHFRDAAARGDPKLARALIVDLRYAFAYIEDHLSADAGIDELARRAASAYTPGPAP